MKHLIYASSGHNDFFMQWPVRAPTAPSAQRSSGSDSSSSAMIHANASGSPVQASAVAAAAATAATAADSSTPQAGPSQGVGTSLPARPRPPLQLVDLKGLQPFARDVIRIVTDSVPVRYLQPGTPEATVAAGAAGACLNELADGAVSKL